MQLDILMQKNHENDFLTNLYCQKNLGMNSDYSFIRVKVDIVAGHIDDVLLIVFFGLLNSV